MGQEFLIDTNIAIAFLNRSLPKNSLVFLDSLYASISVITRIELLGWPMITQEEIGKIDAFISDATVYPLSEPVVQKTIAIRQSQKIKTPDAIIAATAVVHGLTLLTRNTVDFRTIPELKFSNPFEL